MESTLVQWKGSKVSGQIDWLTNINGISTRPGVSYA